MQGLFVACNTQIDLNRVRLGNTSYGPFYYKGVNAWTPKVGMMNAFELLYYQRMIKIIWTARVRLIEAG